MSEKKVVVPDGMISACRKAWRDTDGGFHDSREVSVVICEAALRWLSKRSPDMTQESIKRIADSIGINPTQAFDAIDLGVRRMFLAPEPEVKFYRKVGDEYIEIENPSEELKEMFNIPPGGGKTACVIIEETEMIGQETINEFCSRYKWIRDAVIEAYRRGKESK